jgi:hypothetical protein
VPGAYTYDSALTGTRYVLNTAAADQVSAEAGCVTLGGHLVSYTSKMEQADVEGYFVASGGIIPSYHQFYWMGLQLAIFPAYAWLDTSLPELSNKTYVHWAKGAPNRRAVCAGASYAGTWGGAWGWQDAECGQQAIAICKANSEQMRHACMVAPGRTPVLARCRGSANRPAMCCLPPPLACM